jgi:hypothetical protein
MISQFSEVVEHDEGDYKEHLDKVALLHIFEPIFDEYKDIDVCKKIIKFIAYAYSIYSSKISIGGDRRKEKSGIFKTLEIPVELYQDVVLLNNMSIVKASQNWMRSQDNRQLEYLLTLEELYVQQQTAALQPLKKSDGISIDYDQKQKCIEHMTDLKKMISDAESTLQQNDPKLKQAYEEVKTAKQKIKTLGPEAYAH